MAHNFHRKNAAAEILTRLVYTQYPPYAWCGGLNMLNPWEVTLLGDMACERKFVTGSSL